MTLPEPDDGSRRPGRVRRFRSLLPVCFLVLAACSAAPAGSAPGASSAAPATASSAPSFVLASPLPTNAAAGELFSGTLSMDAIEGGCAYLQADDGRRLEVIYPEGWELRKSPLELTAPDGSVHSRAGDRVSVRGSEAGDVASICQIGPIIRADEVVDR